MNGRDSISDQTGPHPGDLVSRKHVNGQVMHTGSAKTMKRAGGKVTVLDPTRRKSASIKTLNISGAEVYLSTVAVELYPFDEAYLRRLQAHDPATESHFVYYFDE